MLLATPFDAGAAVDHASLAREVEHALDAGAGVDGVVALGVFGEATALSLAEQQQVAGTVARAASGARVVLCVSGRSTDVPVFGGLGGVGLIDELAAGAAGAMTGCGAIRDF